MDMLTREQQQDVVCEFKCRKLIAVCVDEASRQLNMGLKQHQQCLKRAPKPLIDLGNFRSRLTVALDSLEGGQMVNFKRAWLARRLISAAQYMYFNQNN